MKQVDVFLAGVSKSATTWIYHCLKEHPEVCVPSSDSLRFFDLKFHKGMKWYSGNFPECAEKQIVVDASPTYFRSPVAISRIATQYPHAKFILSLRNPVERAFSQYWHESKSGAIKFPFKDVLHRFVLYSWIVEHGFYATHLEKMLRYVAPENIKVMLHDELKADPEKFLSNIYEFMGVDAGFKASVIGSKINEAQSRLSTGGSAYIRAVRRLIPKKGNAGYKKGMDPLVRSELLEIYLPEIEKLETMIDRDLSAWK